MRDIYIGPHPQSASFTLKTLTKKHKTVITTSIHNAAKAGKQKLCILIATLEAASHLCHCDSGPTTESLAANVLQYLSMAITHRTSTNIIQKTAAQYYTNEVHANRVSICEEFTCGSVQQ
jgi:hypothetical protein